jgi:hypothetical protein
VSKRLSRETLINITDADLAWRRQELSALRTGIRKSTGPAIDTATRTAVALAYAHWEGYVVRASRALLEYVTGLRLSYEDLADSYVAMCMTGRFKEAEQSTRRIGRHIDVVKTLRQPADRATFPDGDTLIQAEGNLKAAKFSDLIARLALDESPFELHYHWLDSELLRRRNNIAHGQAGYADVDFAIEAITVVAGLLDQFRTAVQNAVVREVYRRPAVTPPSHLGAVSG